MARTKKANKGVHDELAEEIGDEFESGEDESELIRATGGGRQGESAEIKDHKGRKIRVKVERIDPESATDDNKAYC